MSSRTFASTGRVLAAAVAALTAMLLWSTGPASAQQGAVTGQVVDASNLQPVVGAQVFFPELDRGTLTDESGNFRITGLPAGQHEIRVRLLGYRPATREVTIEPGQTATIDFQLRVSAVSLGEIVVTQTGEQEARELGRAVSTIDAAEQVQKSQSGSIQDLIKGRATGTTIRSTSGSVGSSQNFNIRGNTTLSLDNTPLIYIDGVRVENQNASTTLTLGQQTSRISDLNPEDIESIQVLKGPSATTLYGSEAASGVIVIETKQGSAGDTRWTGRAEFGGNWDSTDWISNAFNIQPASTAATAIPGGNLRADPLIGAFPGKDTVYLMNLLEGEHPGISSPFRTGIEQNYGGTVRGGFAEGDVTYYVSGEWDEQKGNLATNKVSKWNARANVNLSPSEDVDISVSNGFTTSVTNLPQNDNNSFGFIGTAQVSLPLWTPFERQDPFSGAGTVTTCPFAFEFARIGFAPLPALSGDGVFCQRPGLDTPGRIGGPFLGLNFDNAELTKTEDNVQRYTGSATVTARPADFWTARVTVGYDEFDQVSGFTVPAVPALEPFSSLFEGSIFKQNQRNQNLTLQATNTADFGITDELSSSTTAGVQWFGEQAEAVAISCQNFPPGSPACDNSALIEKGGNDFFFEERTIGIFGEQQFSWRDRLFITGGLRADDNSAFGGGAGFEIYPQASFSWVLSDEEFFPAFFDQFKLRAAWGQAGQQPSTNDALALLSANPVPFRGQDVPGISAGQPGNPDLTPARVTEIEAGADWALADGRLSGTFTWYRQTTEDDVVTRPLPASSGFPFAQIANIGGTVNTGIETELNATAFSLPDLTWDLSAQVSTNFNEVTELETPIDVGDETLGTPQRHAEGFPFAAFFSQAVFLNDAGEVEVTPSPVFEAPGIDVSDPTPNVNGSLSSTLTLFNQVTLYGLAEWATGHQQWNLTEEFMAGSTITRTTQNFEVATGDEQSFNGFSKEAELKTVAADADAQLNFVEDADYVKLRTVSLRFDLPQSWTRFFSGDDVSFQLTGENLATFTPFFTDPEATATGTNNGAMGNFLTLPPAKRVTASLQMSF